MTGLACYLIARRLRGLHPLKKEDFYAARHWSLVAPIQDTVGIHGYIGGGRDCVSEAEAKFNEIFLQLSVYTVYLFGQVLIWYQLLTQPALKFLSCRGSWCSQFI